MAEGIAAQPTNPMQQKNGLPGTKPEKPLWAKVRRRAGIIVFAFPAILALSLIVNGARQASVRGDASVKAERDLREAFTDIPFKIRLPKVLPENAPMVRAVLDKPDSKQGFQAYQLNVWYTVRGSSPDSGKSVHVWQTNDKFLARRLRDPLDRDEAIARAAPPHVSLRDPFGHESTVVIGHRDLAIMLRKFGAPERSDAAGAEQDGERQEKFHARTMAAGARAGKRGVE